MKKILPKVFILSILISCWFTVECQGQTKSCMLDLGIILDESASIWSVYFEQVKRLAVKFTELVQPSTDGSHISIMTFSTEAKMVYNFRDPESVSPTLGADKIWSIVQAAGPQTCTDLALKRANEEMFNSDQIRQGVTQILVYFSDGQSNCASYSEVMQLAEALKRRDIIILSLGVGSDVSEKELLELSTDNKNYFHAVDYDKAVQSVNTLLERSCKYAEVNTPIVEPSLVQVEETSLVSDPSLVIDFGVVIDINLWVNEKFFEFVKMIPMYLMQFLGTSQSGIRVAAIYFSREAKFLYKFDSTESYNIEAATRLISTIVKSESPEICNEVALQMAHDEMFIRAAGRENAPKVMLYVATGFTSCKGMEEEWKWVQKLKQMGITIFSLGIGDRVDTYEMSMIASGGSNYFHIASYTEIRVALKQIVLAALNYASSGILKVNVDTSTIDFQDDLTLLALDHRVACGFILDESAYASADVFRMMRVFMIQMSKYLKISQGDSRTSAIFFSSEPRSIWGFDWMESNDMTTTLRRLYSMEQTTDKRSCSEKALDEASRYMFKNPSSNGLAKVLILMTAASNDCGGLEEMRKHAFSIQGQNVLVFSVGFGSDARITEMQAVASAEENYIAISTWTQLAGSIRTVIELISKYELVAIITPISTPDTPAPTPAVDPSNIDTNIVTPGLTDVFDIGIIVDESSGFRAEKFMITLDFVTKIMTKFSTQIGGTRISVMTFALQSRILWKFSDIQSVDINSAGEYIKSFQKSTESQVCSDQALKMASLEMFNQRFHRNGVKKFILFITSDENNCGGIDLVKQFSNEVKERGIAILSFGIGHSINLNELIVMSTSRELVYEYKTVEELYSSLDLIYSTVHNFQIELYAQKDTDTAIDPIPEVTTPKVPTPVKAYGKLDLVIIIDDSISTSTGDFENMKEMVIKIIQLTGTSVDGTRTSVIYFSKRIRVIWSLSSPESSDLPTATKTLYDVQQTKDSFTCVGAALMMAYEEMITNGREGVQKAVIIFTDGRENCDKDGNVLADATAKLKAFQISVIAVGIGQNIRMEDLQIIANPSSNAVPVTRFSEVLILIEKLLVITSKAVISDQNQNFCPDCPHDIGIMFDSGILYFDGLFESLKHYISALFQTIFQQSTNSKVSVGIFEKHSRVLWSFNAKEAVDLDSVISFFTTVQQSGEKTVCLKTALITALDVMFAPEAVRKDSRKSLILIIGGSDNCDNSEAIRDMANNLALRGIQIFVVMIGKSPEMFDPKLMSSSSDTSFYYVDLHAAFDARSPMIKIVLTHVQNPTPGNIVPSSRMTDVGVIPGSLPPPRPPRPYTPEPSLIPDIPKEDAPNVVKPDDPVPIAQTVDDPIPDPLDTQGFVPNVPDVTEDLPYNPVDPPTPTSMPIPPSPSVTPILPTTVDTLPASVDPGDVKPDLSRPSISSIDVLPSSVDPGDVKPDLSRPSISSIDVLPSSVDPGYGKPAVSRPSISSIDVLPSSVDPGNVKPDLPSDIPSIPISPPVVPVIPPYKKKPTTYGRKKPTLPPQPPMHINIMSPPNLPIPLQPHSQNVVIQAPSSPPPYIPQPTLPPQKIEIHMPPAPPPVKVFEYSPRLSLNPVLVTLKACPHLSIERVGCFPAIYKGFFDTRIAKPFCKHANQCLLNKIILSKLICHCAAKAKKHGIKVFAVTKKGSCLGSAHKNAVMQRLRTSLSTCRSEIGYQCNNVDQVCIGGPESMFIYKV